MTPEEVGQLPRVPVQRVMSREDALALDGAVVPAIEPNLTTAQVLVEADTGEPLAAYYPLGNVTDLRRSVLSIRYGETIRKRLGIVNESRTFGMAPRKVIQGRESCRATSLATEQPDAHAALVGLSVRLAADLRAFAPDRADADAAVLAEVEEDWRMADGALWTSGVVNRTSTLPYHRDRFNFPTWSAMPVLRRGVSGGHLHVPEYGITFGCRDGWVAWFCGQYLVHGVTPMRQDQPDGYRISVVYYALQGMKDCHTAALEAGRAREVRTQREQEQAEILRGQRPPKVKSR